MGIEAQIGYTFHNINLLKEALTHPSIKRLTGLEFSYQRLEFLGDKVLGFIIAKVLIFNFPKENEGMLSKRHSNLVCRSTLAQIAKNLNLGSFLILAQNQIDDGGRESENILENATEALIGAIFLDGGLEQAEKFINKYFANFIQTEPVQDSKSTLQEWFQKKYKKIPEYALVKNGNMFEVTLEVEKNIFKGCGKSIKEAEKECAFNALNYLT